MSDHISEQEILKLLKKLDLESIETGREQTRSSTESGIDEQAEDGYIKVNQGEIIVVNPSQGGKIPTLRAKSPVILHVDGQAISRRTKVSSESEISWEIEENPLFEICISEDKIYAYLVVYRTHRHAWSLTDKAHALDVTLSANEDTTIILEQISLQDVLNVVDHMSIKINIDVAAIQTEILYPTHQRVIIARGKPPGQGQDAQLDLYFSEKIENIFTEVGGLADYRNYMNIPSVKSGDVIAKKTPPIEGQTGYDVFGMVLLPNPVKDIRIACRNHVEITPDFLIIAKKEGRPRVTGNTIKYFDINTAYIVPGDVDLQTGNIVFAGDVIVYGDVTDNMIIESLGNIYVAGSVFNSTLTATGSIAVKGNIIGSKLYSGYFGMLYNRLYNGSKQLKHILEKIIESARLLLNEIGKKKIQVRYGQALLLIIESKYIQVWDVTKELLGVISSLQSFNKNDMQQLKDYLALFLLPTKIVEVMTVQRMEDFMRVLTEAFMRVALSQESQVQININQSQSSTIKSNGDIVIRREGIIQCDLYSAGNIIFNLDSSTCRGSTLEAGDTISAMNVGGLTGVGTCLIAKKKVIVKKMFEGRVIVDRYSVDIFEPVEDQTFDRYSIKKMRGGN